MSLSLIWSLQDWYIALITSDRAFLLRSWGPSITGGSSEGPWGICARVKFLLILRADGMKKESYEREGQEREGKSTEMRGGKERGLDEKWKKGGVEGKREELKWEKEGGKERWKEGSEEKWRNKGKDKKMKYATAKRWLRRRERKRKRRIRKQQEEYSIQQEITKNTKEMMN